MGCFLCCVPKKLSHSVYGLVQARNFSGCIVLMIYTLRSSLIDRASSFQQSSLSSSLIVSGNSSVYFLDCCFYAGTDCFISISLGLADKDSLLRRLDICQNEHLLYNHLFFARLRRFRTRTYRRKHTIVFYRIGCKLSIHNLQEIAKNRYYIIQERKKRYDGQNGSGPGGQRKYRGGR